MKFFAKVPARRLLPPATIDFHSLFRADSRALLLLLVLAVFFPFCSYTQISSGRLTGTVTDHSGGIIQGVKVRLTNASTGVVTTVNSTATGTYVFEAQNPGLYTLEASAKGYKTFRVDGVQIHVQQDATIDIVLELGTVLQEVRVTAAAPLLQAQDAALGQIVGTEAMNDMPLNGRDWASLAELAAGVNTVSGGNTTTTAYFTSDGINYHQNDYRLNGIDNNVEIYADSQITTNASITPPPDAIQEFKLQNADYSAEFGHSTSAVINAVTKSGGNEVHGDLWEYLRNEDLDANDYFSKQSGKPRAEYRENQYGGTFGGPVWLPWIYNGRNRTFFFFDAQGTKTIQPSNVYSTVPTNLMVSSGYSNLEDLITDNSGTRTDALNRTFPLGTVFDPATTRTVAAHAFDPYSGLTNPSGSAIQVRDPFHTGGSIVGITNFTSMASQLNQLPTGRLDSNAIKLLGVYPAQNIAGFASNYFQSARTDNTIYQTDLRLDEALGPKDTLFGVWSWAHYKLFTPGSLPGIGDGQSSSNGTKDSPHWALTFGYTHLFTSTLTNELHAGYLHNVDNALPQEGDTYGIPGQFGIQGVPQLSGNGGLPAIDIGGLSNIGVASYIPTIRTITTLELADNLTKVHLSQTWKAGYQIDDIDAPITQPPYGKGFFNYSGQFSSFAAKSSGLTGIADLLLVPALSSVNGTNFEGGVTQFSGSNYSAVDDHRYYMGAYFQDDWKLTPRLTVNLGLRWDLTTPYLERNGRQANFVPANGNGPAGVYYLPDQTCNTPRSASFNNLATKDGISIACISGLRLGDANYDNFAPRIGAAYRVLTNFVIRGGFGISYGNLDSIGFGGTLGQNYPFLYTINATAANSVTPYTLPNGQTATMENALATINLQDATQLNPATGVALAGRQFQFSMPYIETWNATVQYQLGNSNSFQIGYVGSAGRHLDAPSSVNSASQIVAPGASIYSYIPFPDFGPNSEVESTKATSRYNSLQTVFTRQMSRGLYVLANYTYAKCLTDQMVFGGTLPLYRAEWLPGFGIGRDYRLCATDATHVIHVSGTWELPVGPGRMLLPHANGFENELLGGWAFNYIFTHETGQPVNVTCPVPTTAFFGCNADLVPGVDKYAGPHNQLQWLNPAAFVNPPVAGSSDMTFDVLGSAGMQARGPVFNNLDASLFKNFSIREDLRLQFRAESFNVSNTPQFSNPGSLNFQNLTGFSKITSERGASRKVQFSLKLYY